jgi:hypothetical protein
MGKKLNSTRERGQVFGLHFQPKGHGQGSGMCVGNRREYVGR